MCRERKTRLHLMCPKSTDSQLKNSVTGSTNDTYNPFFVNIEHRHRLWKSSYCSRLTLPGYGFDRGQSRDDHLQRWPWSGGVGARPAGGHLSGRVDASRWGWRWNCLCRCSFSGRLAPRWEPAGPSLLRNYRSTPAGVSRWTLKRPRSPGTTEGYEKSF